MHELLVVVVLEGRSDKGGGQEVAVAHEVQEGDVLVRDSVFELFGGEFVSVSAAAVFDVVGKEGVLGHQYHEQGGGVHAPAAVVGEDLVEVVARQEQHRFQSDQPAAFGPLETDEREGNQVLDVDGVHVGLEHPDLHQQARDERVPEAELQGQEAEGVAEGDEGSHAVEQTQKILRYFHC